jgi:hypothetical protein
MAEQKWVAHRQQKGTEKFGRELRRLILWRQKDKVEEWGAAWHPSPPPMSRLMTELSHDSLTFSAVKYCELLAIIFPLALPSLGS